MNERINGVDPFKDFNKRLETPEDHRLRFDFLVEKLNLQTLEFTSRNEDGSRTDLTVYHGIFGVAGALHAPMLRVHALLAGMKEAVPPFIQGPYTQDESGRSMYDSSYILLAYYKPSNGTSRSGPQPSLM